MKFVRGLSILGLAMASQGAWAAYPEDSVTGQVFLQTTSSCTPSISFTSMPDTVGDNEGGSEENPYILTNSVSDGTITIKGSVSLTVAGYCPINIAVATVNMNSYDLVNNVSALRHSVPMAVSLDPIEVLGQSTDSPAVSEKDHLVSETNAEPFTAYPKGSLPQGSKSFGKETFRGSVTITISEI